MFIVVRTMTGWIVQNIRTYVIAYSTGIKADAERVCQSLNNKST